VRVTDDTWLIPSTTQFTLCIMSGKTDIDEKEIDRTFNMVALYYKNMAVFCVKRTDSFQTGLSSTFSVYNWLDLLTVNVINQYVRAAVSWLVNLFYDEKE